jgi:hypothetical protein
MAEAPMFEGVDPWEVALWIVAAYLAVVSLARMMTYEHDRLVARFRQQLQTERRRQAQFILARKRRAAAERTANSHDAPRLQS